MSRLPPSGPVTPGMMFQWLRYRRLSNTLRNLLGQSLIRPLTIFLCSLLVWSFVFFISREGFTFMKVSRMPLTGGIIGLLFDLLFLTLMVMLIFSTGIILYSSLFNADETKFLLSSPATADHIFAFKYQGAIAFSSWAFILLGSPILIAYGIVAGVPLLFYPIVLLFFLGFVLVPGSLGAILCLLLVNFMPQRRKQVVILSACFIIAGIVLFIYSSLSSLQYQVLTGDVVERMIGRVSMATGALVPSHWISEGIVASARGQWGEMAYFLALVWANGLMLYLLATWLSSKLYRRGYNRVTTGGTLRRRYGGHWLDRILNRLLFFMDEKTRLLIVKDFRTFRRDPSQWLQIVIFCGLLLAYFTNIRRMFVNEIEWESQNSISALNLSVTAFLLCAYTGRFVYPLLSLEGRKFWILGLMPLEREKLLWGKFVFSSIGALMISISLILVSDFMLQMPLLAIIVHVSTITVLSLGLSGLSVGLGAMMPNFRETDPSKIAVGFGGTLNLVVGLSYLVFVIGLMAGPWHIMAGIHGSPNFGLLGTILTLVGLSVGVILGVIAVVLPLKLGARTLREMEF